MTVQFNPQKGSRGIQWCDETRNVTGGCEHACQWEMPDGTIAECYAKTVAEWLAVKAYPDGFEQHYWRPHKLRELVRGDDPLLIFADSMSDLFGSWVPEEHTIAVLKAMADAPHHTYQLLTKAPGRLAKFVDYFPPNLWIGVSSPPDFFRGARLNRDQQARMLRRGVAALAEVREATGNITFMSLEPVSWDIASEMPSPHMLDWAIIGAATNGPRKYQPDPAHVEPLLDLFDRTGTPVFFKGNISKLVDEQGWRWREDFPIWAHGQVIPAVLRRQEMAREHGWTLNFFLKEDVEQRARARQTTYRRTSDGTMAPSLF